MVGINVCRQLLLHATNATAADVMTSMPFIKHETLHCKTEQLKPLIF